MTRFLQKKRGFTLIEMLIVIVIIGILASALIPRLSLARERANDTARKAHVQNIASVLVAYQIDKGRYPTTAGSIASIQDALIGAGLSSVPIDPDATRQFYGIKVGTNTCVNSQSPAGQYMYTPVIKRGIAGAGFVLMAGTQTEGGSNWVYENTLTSGNYVDAGCMSAATDYAKIGLCQTLTAGSSTSLQNCAYNNSTDTLRYIYTQ